MSRRYRPFYHDFHSMTNPSLSHRFGEHTALVLDFGTLSVILTFNLTSKSNVFISCIFGLNLQKTAKFAREKNNKKEYSWLWFVKKYGIKKTLTKI